MSPEPRVWLLPNGNPLTRATEDGPFVEHPRLGIEAVGGDYSRWRHNSELPEGAVPLVALPEPNYLEMIDGVVFEQHGKVRAFPIGSTLDDARRFVGIRQMQLADAMQALRMMEDAAPSAEAARQRVLQDLRPGVYSLKSSGPRPSTALVTPDGKFLWHAEDGTVEDKTKDYASAVDNGFWRVTLLAEGDLSPVVTE